MGKTISAARTPHKHYQHCNPSICLTLTVLPQITYWGVMISQRGGGDDFDVKKREETFPWQILGVVPCRGSCVYGCHTRFRFHVGFLMEFGHQQEAQDLQLKYFALFLYVFCVVFQVYGTLSFGDFKDGEIAPPPPPIDGVCQ